MNTPATITASSTSNGNRYMQAQAGAHVVLFTVYRDGTIRVHVQNAMARVYRTGTGRTFRTWGEAVAAYKNANVRATIEEAQRTAEVATLVGA